MVFILTSALNFLLLNGIYDFKVPSLEGGEIDFSKFKGKKILIVNTASKCGYTKQYEDLQRLFQAYRSKLVVVGFPANNFGGQEPGSNSEIKSFAERKGFKGPMVGGHLSGGGWSRGGCWGAVGVGPTGRALCKGGVGVLLSPCCACKPTLHLVHTSPPRSPSHPPTHPSSCHLQFAKTDVNGPDASPLFGYLKAQQGGMLTSDISEPAAGLGGLCLGQGLQASASSARQQCVPLSHRA